MVEAGGARVYVDASALVKTIVTEAESDALIAYLSASSRQVSSRLIGVEVARAVGQVDQAVRQRGAEALEVIDFIELDAPIASVAASVAPSSLRTLDAIHLASALAVITEIDAFITYDLRLGDAARAAGLTVVAPA